MPPKTKKEKQKETKKIVEDKTFGLKNKNKSKKVQQYVTQVQKQAQHRVDQGSKKQPGASSATTDSKLSKKQMLEARMAELNLVYRPVKDKEKKLSPEEEEKKRREEEEERERLRIASLPVEDQIEEERAKLKTKTPVTLELFLQWKEKKRQEKTELSSAKKKIVNKTNLTKGDLKKGGILTGRELFEFNRDVFVDDENADDDVYERDDNYSSDEDGKENRNGEGDGQENGDEHDGENHVGVDADAFNGPDDAQANAVGDESLFS
mmetsp:Transcript_3665/g.10959  ORF Transcript_3665/g.10959 Transcript_3665/m.10959 type:complete len:265 (-) Transcript_3665:1458-2252(-)|eukprot:CAMPEP_0198732198 /NCGR_PEP_ID=MMETSP1475-20131203/34356_1 /TAXON_ID= ORGANISM="Unidentified sp., Strain CCMP1999" /NCGR_SAMPLE_ID=MMETSP1475 /ASSEMBLY_ACC=CAM_ASM_001111 /LENGTH=264 /DNA_ID=CAMNT_0044495263 /DNA_START=78 /DNA_END=872 /DNA_ORIENTATION=-